MRRLRPAPAFGAVLALGSLVISSGLAVAGSVRVEAGSGAPGEPPGAIAGTVTETVSDEPVADLLVMFADASQFPSFAITGADGRYTSPPLEPGPYFVQTSTFLNRQLWLIDEVYDDFPCFQGHCDRTAGTRVTVLAGQTTAGIDFALDRGGVLTGRVTREADGEPVPGVVVEAWLGATSARSSLTGTDGVYVVEGLPAGSYTLITTSFLGLIDELHAPRSLRELPVGSSPRRRRRGMTVYSWSVL